MLGSVDCQWDFDGTLSGQIWTNMRIANDQLSVEVSECDKKRAEPGNCKARVNLEEPDRSLREKKFCQNRQNGLYVKIGKKSFANEEIPKTYFE